MVYWLEVSAFLIGCTLVAAITEANQRAIITDFFAVWRRDGCNYTFPHRQSDNGPTVQNVLDVKSRFTPALRLSHSSPRAESLADEMRENDRTFWNFIPEYRLSSLRRSPFKLKGSSSRLPHWELLFCRGWWKKDICLCKRLKWTVKLPNESTQKGSDFFSESVLRKSLGFRWGSKRNKV